MNYRLYILVLLSLLVTLAKAQSLPFVLGVITGEGRPLASATIAIGNQVVFSDSAGNYSLKVSESGVYIIRISAVGFKDVYRRLPLSPGRNILNFDLLQSEEVLKDVVITGVSRATRMRENPAAIVAVSSKSIDRTIEANVIDALVKNVPGLNAVKTGPNISKPFIRGLGYNRVLTLYDGIRQEGQQWGDEHGIEVDAYDIDRAEVIKGPASIMYGSDAVAGVVSLFPWLPKGKDGLLHGRLLSEYQTNNGLIGNGIRLGSANDHWLWAAKASYRIAKNYTNAVDGRIYNTGFRETNGTATAGYISSLGNTTVSATLYNNLQGIPDGSRDSLTRRFTYQTQEGNLDNVKNRPIVSNHDLNSYVLSPLHQHIQHYRVYETSHYRIGKGAVDVVAGFQQNIRREYDHPTEPGQAGMFVRLNTLNYGMRYTYSGIEGLDLTAGVNGMNQYNKSEDATDFPIPDYQLRDAGAFLFGKWKHGPFSFSGGFRFDTRQIKGSDFYTRTDAITGFSRHAHLPDTSGAVLQFPFLDKQFQGYSLSAGATWMLSKSISVKGNLGRGYRSPNITELASNGLDPGAHIIYLGNRSFVPEFSLEEDLGIDGEFRDIGFIVSVFNNNIQHYIYLSQLVDAASEPIIDAQGNKTFQYEQSAARLYGLEASFVLHPLARPGFTFDNSLTLTYGLNKKNSYKGKGDDGEYLPLIPPARWISGVAEELSTGNGLFKSVTGRAELEYNAPQNRYLALYGTETPTPSYSLVNLSAGTVLRYNRENTMQVLFQLSNLLNTIYQSNLSRLKYLEYYSASPNGHTGIYNMGRNVCLKLIASF